MKKLFKVKASALVVLSGVMLTAATLLSTVQTAQAQGMPAAKPAPASPADSASVSVNGKTIKIKYSSPSVKGRQIFGAGGLLSKDPTYPAWRAGANSATAFSTDADLEINGLAVPKGNYTLYVLISNPDSWELIINKQLKQWGTEYKKEMDLGRVKITMSKPSALVERVKYTLAPDGANKAKLTLAWENHVATVPLTVK